VKIIAKHQLRSINHQYLHIKYNVNLCYIAGAELAEQPYSQHLCPNLSIYVCPQNLIPDLEGNTLAIFDDV